VALIDGVYEHRLVEFAEQASTEEDGSLAAAAIETCRRIEAELGAEIAVLRPLLDGAGIAIDGAESVEGRQNHTITFRVPDARVAEAAAVLLARHGFTIWESWSGGALESFRRSADQITVARTADVTTVVRFRWRARHTKTRIARIVTPTAGDWHLVDLPSWAWWGYPLVRPLRLVAERIGLRPKHQASLGPFLSTPDALLDPLFEHVGLSANDIVVDLGAGDGRVAIAAASRAGCRAVGVEHDPELVGSARRRASAAGVADRVEFVQGDARSIDLRPATVVFVFLPIDVVADLLDDVLARLPAGARVIVHEQSRLPRTLHPESSTVIVGGNAVTVAHVWRVP
jgi:hypothetical protein